MKFTKGPWSTKYKARKDGMYSQAVFDSFGEYICECSWYKVPYYSNGILVSTTTNREQNAHLIAAAPEMYEILEMAMNILNGDDAINEVGSDDIEKLLAKARGESQE